MFYSEYLWQRHRSCKKPLVHELSLWTSPPFSGQSVANLCCRPWVCPGPQVTSFSLALAWPYLSIKQTWPRSKSGHLFKTCAEIALRWGLNPLPMSRWSQRALLELLESSPGEGEGRSGEVPAEWKLANIIPVYKKGMREDAGNYRPVSLSSVPGKIMEQIILGAIERRLKNNAILRHGQHGFTKENPVWPIWYPSAIRSPA